MNQTFYNNTYTLLVTKQPSYKVPSNIKIIVGNFQDSYSQIIEDQINKDLFYNGHIINLDNSTINITEILKNKLTRNNIYFNSVSHYPKEYADPSLIFCSSWVLPLIYDTPFDGKFLYSKCYLHRLDILKLNRIL